MNLEAVRFVDLPPAPRQALTTPNPANAVEHHLFELHLEQLVATRVENIFITGSNVWKPALGLPIDPTSDIDIMVVGDEGDCRNARDCVVAALDLKDGSVATGPSMSEDRDAAVLPGQKYLDSHGRTVDIWGMASVYKALQQYPEHSHSSSRMAWDCEHGCLIMFPNTSTSNRREIEPTYLDPPETLIDPVPGVTW